MKMNGEAGESAMDKHFKNVRFLLRRLRITLFLPLLAIVVLLGFQAKNFFFVSGSKPIKLFTPILSDSTNPPPNIFQTGNTDIISYAYFEAPEAKKNLQFFLDHALHGKADFIFVMNSGYSVTIPDLPNIRVIQRDNTCYDMGRSELLTQGAHKEVLDHIWIHYKRFILTNASIRGPFIPSWVENKCWSDKIYNYLHNNTKMVGLTANCNYHEVELKHIQSMLLAFDHESIQVALGHFRCFEDYDDAVNKGEIALTPLIRSYGWNAVPMASFYKSYDGTLGDEKFWEKCYHGDFHFPKAYHGMDLHPFDTMFSKVKKKNPSSDYGKHVFDSISKWTDDNKFSSFDYCK